MNDNPIGVFDSGVGGLSVVSELLTQLPNEDIVYFADLGRYPYGNKLGEAVYRYSKQICRFLINEHNVKAIIIACNSATVNSLERLQNEFDIPIIGVVKPAIDDAISQTNNNNIGILATKTTIESGFYQENILKLNSDLEIYTKACPLFVSLVEENKVSEEYVLDVANEYLKSMKDNNVDTIILGCTHYLFIESIIQKCAGSNVKLINPANNVASYMYRHLRNLNILACKTSRNVIFYSSSPYNEVYEMLASKIMNKAVNAIIFDIDIY